MKALAILALCLQLSSIALGQNKNCECSDCKGSLELGIILDSSSSIPQEAFEQAREFLQDFVRVFSIGPNDVRVSFVHFGREVHKAEAFYLDTYKTKAEVLSALGAVVHHHQDYTNTGEAIQFMRTDQLNKNLCRDGVPRVAVVVTDGNSQKWTKTEKEAKLARDSGIVIYTVGIGLDISKQELLRISGDENHIIQVDKYEHLKDITLRLAKGTCEAAQLAYHVEKREL